MAPASPEEERACSSDSISSTWTLCSVRDPARALAEVLEVCRGKAGVNIELKYYGHDQALEQRVVDVVEAAGINFADLMARIGVYPDAPPLPAVVGYEVAGGSTGGCAVAVPLELGRGSTR